MSAKPKSTADKLRMFRQNMREHYAAKLNGNTVPQPSIQEFSPEVRRFAEQISDEELSRYETAVAEKQQRDKWKGKI